MVDVLFLGFGVGAIVLIFVITIVTVKGLPKKSLKDEDILKIKSLVTQKRAKQKKIKTKRRAKSRKRR